MASLWRLTAVEFRYLLKIKELWLAMAAIIFYTGAIYLYTKDDIPLTTDDYYYQLINDVSFYVFILVPAFVLSKDYSFKTIRILYTGPFSKNKIVCSKFLSVFVFYIVASVVHRVSANGLMLYDVSSFSLQRLLQEVPQTMLIYAIAGLFTCALAFFVTLLTYSQMATMISIVTIFIIEKFSRGVLLLIFPQENVKLVLTHNPLYIALHSLQYSVMTIMDSFILLMTTLFLGLAICLLLRNKEIQ